MFVNKQLHNFFINRSLNLTSPTSDPLIDHSKRNKIKLFKLLRITKRLDSAYCQNQIRHLLHELGQVNLTKKQIPMIS